MNRSIFNEYSLPNYEGEPWRNDKVTVVWPRNHGFESQKQPLTKQGKTTYNRPFPKTLHWQELRIPNCPFYSLPNYAISKIGYMHRIFEKSPFKVFCCKIYILNTKYLTF